MDLKKEILDSLKKEQYSKNEVVNLLGKLGPEKSVPNILKIGDVFLDYVGVKKRPCVIVKVFQEEGIVVCFPMSTKESEMNLCEYNSRFYGNGFLQNQLITTPYNIALQYFIGVFDNNRVIQKALKKHKQFYNKI